MKAAKNHVVSIAYQVKNEDGIVVDESTQEVPLQYLHGHDNLIVGLENAIENRQKGEKFEATVAPEDAYGEYMDAFVQRVPKEIFQQTEEFEVGMRFLADTDQGMIPVEITAVEDDMVVVDGNHMLAGQTLHFSVEVLDIREATEEEIAHGHVHQEGGCGGHHHDKEGCCGDHGHHGEEACCSGHGDKDPSEEKQPKKDGCCGACH